MKLSPRVALFLGITIPSCLFSDTFPNGDILTTKIVFSNNDLQGEAALTSTSGMSYALRYQFNSDMFSLYTDHTPTTTMLRPAFEDALNNFPSSFFITQEEKLSLSIDQIVGKVDVSMPSIQVNIQDQIIAGSNSFRIKVDRQGTNNLDSATHIISNISTSLFGYNLVGTISDDLNYITVTSDRAFEEGSYTMGFSMRYDVENSFHMYNNGDLLLNGTLKNIIGFGNLFQLEVVSAIPEPSSYALIAGISALGVFALRRRKSSLC